MNRNQYVNLWSVMVGAMDAMTGMMLVFVPSFVLSLLGIPALGDTSLLFLSWIGVFVFGVGLSYGLVLICPQSWKTVWSFTAGIRLLVCIFLTTKIVMHEMPLAWFFVAAADGGVALVQGILVIMARKEAGS